MITSVIRFVVVSRSGRSTTAAATSFVLLPITSRISHIEFYIELAISASIRLALGVFLLLMSLEVELGPKDHVLMGLRRVRRTVVQLAQVVAFQEVHSQLGVVFVVFFVAVGVTKVTVVMLFTEVTVQHVLVEEPLIAVFTCLNKTINQHKAL